MAERLRNSESAKKGEHNIENIPVRNSCSILTASVMMCWTVSGWGRRLRWLRSRQAKSVRKCQAGNQAPLLEPEDRRERPGEEDSLDGGEGRLLVGDPTHGPVGLV